MNAVRNYQKELEKIIDKIAEEKEPPRLFLHSCCAPCSSYVLEYLRPFFQITVFYYNPNISMEPEYRRRIEEQKRLIAAYNEALVNRQMQEKVFQSKHTQLENVQLENVQLENVQLEHAQLEHTQHERIQFEALQGYPIDIVEGDYEPELFFEVAKGLEQCPEGGERCFACYELRLRKTSQMAQAGHYDYFATTLTISPLKNAVKLNGIGERLAEESGISWLPSDFKKRGGYQRSIVLSKEYDLYRQDYCGCIFSKQERERSL